VLELAGLAIVLGGLAILLVELVEQGSFEVLVLVSVGLARVMVLGGLVILLVELVDGRAALGLFEAGSDPQTRMVAGSLDDDDRIADCWGLYRITFVQIDIGYHMDDSCQGRDGSPSDVGHRKGC
jgi:hypothetical protein